MATAATSHQFATHTANHPANFASPSLRRPPDPVFFLYIKIFLPTKIFTQNFFLLILMQFFYSISIFCFRMQNFFTKFFLF